MGTWAADLPGVVELPSGRRVRGHGLRRPRTGPEPELGLLLVRRDPGPQPWPHRWVAWPDFRTPTDTADADAVLAEAWERCAVERVEIACGGGLGRTGTALARLAVLDGLRPEGAVDWVRAHYARRAVETPWQRRWAQRPRSAPGP